MTQPRGLAKDEENLLRAIGVAGRTDSLEL